MIVKEWRTTMEGKRERTTGAAVLGLVVCLAVCFLVAGSGGLFRPDDWYAALNKPAFTPPGWLFPPVWTMLYAMMAVAAWLVWLRAGWRGAGAALTAFAVQLVFNGLWSWLFFGLHQPWLALIDLVLLVVAIGVTMAFFRRHSIAAALLLLPYLLWVSFAGVLNGSIAWLNR
jgi:tryptophan-rich sensory protein